MSGGQSSASATRPPLQRRRTTARTRWIDMHLEQEHFSKLHNILASFFTWVLLAGYIVFPATFNKFQKDEDLDRQANNELKAHALEAARNIPLLYIAAFACGTGVLGCTWLWQKHWRNYLWVNNRIFLPALMNSIAGLISTIVNVYTAQEGQYSITAKATIVVTAACSVVTLILLLLFNFILLARVKRKHERETREVEKQFTGGEGYGADLKDKRRKAGGKRHRDDEDAGRMV
ncbi:hypothetical protein BDV96DRAFT_506716 [Lophiotrema nucula]|uniref:Uncharacterized protein n=1 Tax=Lophiotrema nucula TaxID=690887 RepID=A0A6A5YLP2_9PLEO|nr:hypothetical protein BDV96DRAFT_506716 [Lophiotrema nucula]